LPVHIDAEPTLRRLIMMLQTAIAVCSATAGHRSTPVIPQTPVVARTAAEIVEQHCVCNGQRARRMPARQPGGQAERQQSDAGDTPERDCGAGDLGSKQQSHGDIGKRDQA